MLFEIHEIFKQNEFKNSKHYFEMQWKLIQLSVPIIIIV
jgi:hypothetical protein